MPLEEPKNFDLVINMFTRPIYPSEVPKMTIKEHQEFVDGLLKDTIFSSMHIHTEDKTKGDLRKVFLPHNGDYFSQIPNRLLDDIGVLWEFSKEKIGRAHRGSVTGIIYPVFSSVRLCTKFDWDLACDAIKAVKARVNLVVS